MKAFILAALLLASLAPPAQAQLQPDEIGSQLAYVADSLQPKGDCDKDKVLNRDDEDLDGDGIPNIDDTTIECKKDNKAAWILVGTFGALTLLMYDDNERTISP